MPQARSAPRHGTTTGTTATSATGTTGTDNEAGTGAGTGATIGTVLGGGAGLLAGLGMLAIPGVGPVVAAGWLVATALGAGVGAGAGGLLGSLVGAGVNENDAHVYAEGVRRGGTLVTARVDESQRATVEDIMSRHSGVDANVRGKEYRAGGWERFDENAPAYEAGASPMLGAAPTTTGGARRDAGTRHGRGHDHQDHLWPVLAASESLEAARSRGRAAFPLSGPAPSRTRRL